MKDFFLFFPCTFDFLSSMAQPSSDAWLRFFYVVPQYQPDIEKKESPIPLLIRGLQTYEDSNLK